MRLVRRSAVVGLGLIVGLLGGCSTSSSGDSVQDEPAAACAPPPTIALPSLPSDFPTFDEVDPTRAEVKKKFIAVEGFTRRSVEELFKAARPELVGKGFDVINTDFEGFEAELYFAKGASLAGIVALREGPCDGYVKVNVIYDPLETAAGRKAVKKTRQLSGEG